MTNRKCRPSSRISSRGPETAKQETAGSVSQNALVRSKYLPENKECGPIGAASCWLANQLLLSACRRYNAVHPQVFHHLTIVIIPVGRCKSCNRNPGAEPVDRL